MSESRTLLRVAVWMFCLFVTCAHSAPPAISAGGFHSIGVKTDGTVRTWGLDTDGQLGIGRPDQTVNPISTSAISDVKAIAGGQFHSVALKRDGTVWAWGNNSPGQLGDGTYIARPTPVQVTGLSGVVAIAAGAYHTIAVKVDGSVWAWGYNAFGQLGDGTTTFRTTPVQVNGLYGVVAISGGGAHTVALKGDGSVFAWGLNDRGQVGDGTTTNRLTPVQIIGMSGTVAISAGGNFSVALKGDGGIWEWGNNNVGQLGDGTTTMRLTPVQTQGLTSAIAIATGYSHTLAVKSDGSVWAWGSNYLGTLGDGTMSGRSIPLQVGGLTDAVSVSAGDFHSTALMRDGSVYAWGGNQLGQIGDGTTINRLFPLPVTGLAGVVAIAAGSRHTLALKAVGSVLAWGDNSSGQLGDGSTPGQTTPVQVSGLTGVSAVSAGKFHTIALRNDGSVLSWGNNLSGQLGDDSQIYRSTPLQVSGLSSVSAIAAGGFHTCALKADGSVFAWGWNVHGGLGDGTTTSRSTPLQVSGLTGVTAISAGEYHTVALKSDGSVWTWGDNELGQLGDGTTADRLTPYQVSGVTGVVAISGGGYHTIVLKGDGTVWGWGNGFSTTPSQVIGLTGVVAIAGGYGFSAALKGDGTVWTWGSNNIGQLGDGTLIYRTTPVQVSGLTGVVAISAGVGHTIAIKGDGSVLAWGGNLNGQLGDGTYAVRTKPVVVLHENGTGSVAANNWFLDLKPAVTKTIPADKIPAFLTVASLNANDVKAQVQYRAQDIGTSQNTYVFALAPANRVQNASVASLAQSPSSAKGGTSTAIAQATTTSGSCVLAQLNASGQLVATTADSLQAYLTGVLGSQGASVSVLNSVSTALLQGSTFFVGYGTSPTSMFSSGTNRSVLTIGELQACTTPDAFSFVPQTGVALNIAVTSNTVAIGGTNFVAAPINISNGNYRINNGAFVPSVGLISKGDNVTMQVLSSLQANTQTCATLDISGVTAPFCVTTMQIGVTNYALTISKAGLGAGTVTSMPAGISCNGDCSNEFASGTAVSLTAVPTASSIFTGWSGACSGTGICTLTMDSAKSVTATYALTPGTTPPDPFSFAAQNGVGLSQTATSNTVTLAGTNFVAAPISIANGSYRINSGAFTSSPGNVNSGDSVTIQVTASPNYNTQNYATLNIGGVIGTFYVTTMFEPVVAAPVVSLDAISLAFASQYVGTSGSAQMVTLTNSGSAALNIASIAASTDFAVTNTCGASLGIGGFCSLNVTFAPTAAGARPGTITINTNASGSPHSVNVSGTGVALSAPTPPTGINASPGNAQASINFAVPFNNGGSIVTGYAATCNPGSVIASGYLSPIIVTGLTNDVNYTCSVTANNVAGTSVASATASVMPSASVPFALIGVRSRKTHGSAGTFDLLIDTSQSIGGLVTVEPRFIGSGHSLVFQFNGPVSSVGSVGVIPIGSATATYSGSEVLVTVTNIPDNNRVTINLFNVNGSANPPPVSFGLLVGDLNSSRSVSVGDISGVKAHIGQTTNGANFKFDVNGSGSINSQDVSAVKARAGLTLP